VAAARTSGLAFPIAMLTPLFLNMRSHWHVSDGCDLGGLEMLSRRERRAKPRPYSLAAWDIEIVACERAREMCEPPAC